MGLGETTCPRSGVMWGAGRNHFGLLLLDHKGLGALPAGVMHPTLPVPPLAPLARAWFLGLGAKYVPSLDNQRPTTSDHVWLLSVSCETNEYRFWRMSL